MLGDDVAFVLAEPDGGRIATKVAKVRAVLPHIMGDIVCFVDGDVTLSPDALQTPVAPFGVARSIAWETIPTSLMSLFVNTNALRSYLPLTYLTEPFTVTGHCFALRHATLTAIGGFGDDPDRMMMTTNSRGGCARTACGACRHRFAMMSPICSIHSPPIGCRCGAGLSFRVRRCCCIFARGSVRC